MLRARSLRRHAARFAVVLPFAACLQAACGGSDTIPFDSEDAAALDGAVNKDGSMIDSPFDDSTVGDGSMGDGTMSDGTMSDGRITDGTVNDTSNDGTSNDGTLADAADAGDAADAMDASDAQDAFDGADGNVSVNQLDLGFAASFAVFGSASVTNTTTVTTVTGDIGSASGTPMSPPLPQFLLYGAFHFGDSLAMAAQADFSTAYTNLMPANLKGCASLTGTDLGTLPPLPPGVYCFSTSAQLTGALVLDSGGNPNAQWVFQIGSTLDTANNSSVTVIGANPCNVAWQVGSSATLGVDSVFSGNILASASITLNTRAKLTGRALAVVGTVALQDNAVSIAACPTPPNLDGGLDAADASDGD